MVIRLATDNDRQSICTIQQEAARKLAAVHYSDAEIESWVGQLTPQMYDFAAPERAFLIAENAGDIAGFGSLNTQLGVIEAVFVAPAEARRGFGSAILQRLEELAINRGFDRLHLRSTLNAVPFYERAGYIAQGRTTFRSGGGVELAVIEMAKTLPHAIPE